MMGERPRRGRGNDVVPELDQGRHALFVAQSLPRHDDLRRRGSVQVADGDRAEPPGTVAHFLNWILRARDQVAELIEDDDPIPRVDADDFREPVAVEVADRELRTDCEIVGDLQRLRAVMMYGGHSVGSGADEDQLGHAVLVEVGDRREGRIAVSGGSPGALLNRG